MVNREVRSPVGPPRPKGEVMGSRKVLITASDEPAVDRNAVREPWRDDG